jgi:regulator of protease activity HflC (stomatin/prohibitin superfamily)
VVFYHVIDPMTVAFRVNNYYSGRPFLFSGFPLLKLTISCVTVIENSALVALRTTFGGYTLQQALEHRAEISQQVCRLMAPHMTKVGVKVEEAQVLLQL